MKKVLYPFILLAFISFMSCSDDNNEASPEEINNQIIYQERIIPATFAREFDDGNIGDYYNINFDIVGGINQTSYRVILELLSPTTTNEDGFKPGTFKYSSSRPDTPTPYLNIAELVINENERILAKSGTVEVSGTDGEWVLSGKLTLVNDEMVSFHYSGEYTEF